MLVVVETSKWSFTKTNFTNGKYKRVLSSPIPTPFNYGFIDGTISEDCMPLDVIILGRKLEPGTRLDLKLSGKVGFVDDSLRDDKYIASLDGKEHEIAIRSFFSLYVVAKLFIGFFTLGRWTKNKYEGVEWFDEEIDDVRALKMKV